MFERKTIKISFYYSTTSMLNTFRMCLDPLLVSFLLKQGLDNKDFENQ